MRDTEKAKREWIPRCRICHKVVDRIFLFDEVEIICEECLQRFSEEDLYVMIELFNKYGGWFNKYEDIQRGVTTLKEVIQELLDEIDRKKISVFELTSLLMHRGLLYGVPYSKHMDIFKRYLDEE